MNIPAFPTPAVRRRNPHLWTNYAQDPETHGVISNTKPECDKKAALGRAVEGETGSDQRPVVRFVGFRLRPLDPDNFAGSVKDLLDGLQHAALLDGDAIWQIRLETSQVKVAHKSEEKTEIFIEYP